ncbi:MAG TPA: T9SS type A sorting domain-containing protein, partial [Flavobacteriales bacterium]|nr:T9SS type A sorting domain-containing protein [Flavobacteriales bacterium]
WVRRSNFRYATDRIGAYFSTGPVSVSNTAPLAQVPQVQHTPGVPITSSEWVQIYGSFVASGGEDHIVIGSFVNDALTDTVVVNANSDDAVSYYRIDDVSVTHCAVGIDELGLSPADLQVFPQPATDNVSVRCERCTGNTQLQLIDAVGAMVRAEQRSNLSTTATLDLEGLDIGVYFMQVITEGQRAVKPIIVR